MFFLKLILQIWFSRLGTHFFETALEFHVDQYTDFLHEDEVKLEKNYNIGFAGHTT